MRNGRFWAVMVLLGMVQLIPAGAADFDWGGQIVGSGSVSRQVPGEDPDPDILALAALWADWGGLGKSGAEWSFGGRISYEYTDEIPWLVDLDYLRFQYWIPVASDKLTTLTFSAGRFRFTDPSGWVLSHTADGASVRAVFPRFEAGFSAGYTGLMVSPRSDILMTVADWSDSDLGPSEFLGDRFFGSRRIFMVADFLFPVQRGDITAFAAAQFDLRGEDTLLHSQYLGLVSRQRYGQFLEEHFSAILQAGELVAPDLDPRFALGLMVAWDWTYSREDWLGSVFSGRLILTPPDRGGDLIESTGLGVMGFVPISHRELGTAVDPLPGGLALIEAGYSFRPLMGKGSGAGEYLEPYALFRGYFRTWPQSVGWIETDTESESLFLGTEMEGGLRWRPFSDLGVGLTGALFLPAVAPFGAVVEGAEPFWSVSLDVSLNF